MRLLGVFPSVLHYSKIFLRLEPIGLELVAQAARKAGHKVQLIDLQIEDHRAYFRMVERWRPDVIAFSCNYLPHVPEIVDLAKATKIRFPQMFICVGGHSASFTAGSIIEHGAGAIDCVLKGEGEAGMPMLLAAIEGGDDPVTVAGAVTADGEGPPPGFVHSLDDLTPARDLLRHRRKYFLGTLDPCATIEFSRGCPWDCSFCSAWTFYGRSYRLVSPQRVVEDLLSIREPGVFIVDDVAFVHDQHGMEIGEAVTRAGIRKQYYLETRGDVLLRNKEVFRLWQRLGIKTMFLGLEAIDDEGLRKYSNSGNTPYPGTESWITDGRRLETRDYRLFDIQHAVLPTRLPLAEFYRELVTLQRAIYRRHLDWRQLWDASGIAARLLLRGQTNFVKSLFSLDRVYRPELLLADHAKPEVYQIPLPPKVGDEHRRGGASLYIHASRGRKGRAIDPEAERFVEEGRSVTAP